MNEISKEEMKKKELTNKFLKILIAENHRMTAKFLKSIINKHENYQVVDVLSNGTDVVDAMNKFDIDVLLLDLELPNMNGFEVMDKLSDVSKSKVLVLSAYAEDDFIRKSYCLGASGYMTKTASIHEILDGIKAVSEGKSFYDNDSIRMNNRKKSKQ